MSTQVNAGSKVSGDWSQDLLAASKYKLKAPNAMKPVGICLHNTANSAPASNEISYMKNNTKSTSFHMAVDENQAVQAIPFDRNGWHAGDGNGPGNLRHIGIEIARSTNYNGDLFQRSEKRAAAVCAKLCGQYGWGVSQIKAHRDFSGKNCPHRTSMASFRSLVTAAMGGGAETKPAAESKPAAQPVAQPANSTGLAGLLNNNPAVKTNQDLINLFFRLGGNNFTAATAAARSYGVDINALIANRGGKVARPSASAPSGGAIVTGSKVRITGSKYAGGQNIPAWVKTKSHDVSEIKGDKALLGRSGGICSWVLLKDLQIEGGSPSATTKPAAPKAEAPKAEAPKAEAPKPSGGTDGEKKEYADSLSALAKYPGGKLAPSEFTKLFGPIVREDNRKTGVPAAVTLAQAILETGWGGSTIGKAKNLFGIKGTGPAGTTISSTWEVYDGKRVDIKAGFRVYNSWLESVEDHSKFLTVNSRYKNAFNAKDSDSFAREIHKAGYATDPSYSNKLISLMNQYNLKAWDVSKSATQTPAPTTASPTVKPEAPKSATPSTGFSVADAVSSNNKMGYTEDKWRHIQKVVGTTIDGNPGPKTAQQVAAFQGKYGLKVDGIAGPVTCAKIASISPFPVVSPQVTNPTGGNIQQLSTKEVAKRDTGRQVKKVVDLGTKKTFNVSWDSSSGYHSDFTPMTPSDTTVIKSFLSSTNASDKTYWGKTSSWSWNARPAAIQLKDGTWVACGYHTRPHAAIMGGSPGHPFSNQSNSRPASGWAMGGHMCMYYGDSPGGTPKCNTAATEASKMKL